ncbi:MAG TPA: sortase [Candidatus Saccharimonas sp.]|nr:sortase [Candidatus Saccharimonas sp.]
MTKRNRLWGWLYTTVLVVALFAGLYILLVTFAPALPNFGQGENVQTTVNGTQPGARGDRLYVPQIGVDVAIVEGSNISVLDKGAWHRQPQNGNPMTGGNFVLSAHRFSMGWTPQQTRAKSPFYRIDQLKVGDTFFVDFKGARYAYAVSRLYSVPQTAVQIEAQSVEPKLTLYSCDLRGAAAGRYVVEAKPLGKIAG